MSEGQEIDAGGRLAVSLPEGGRMLGLGRNALWTAIREGRGPATFKVGRRHLVRIEELRRWARELETENGDNLGEEEVVGGGADTD